MIVVTGANGFIGSAVMRLLRDMGLPHVGYDVQANDVGVYYLDVTKRKLVAEAVNGADAVIHLAGPVMNTHKKDPYLSATLEVVGAANVLAAAREAGVKVVSLSSSFWVYEGIPDDQVVDERTPLVATGLDLFSLGKLMVEELGRLYTKYIERVVVLRYGSAYGPHPRCSNAIRPMMMAAKQGEVWEVWGKGLRRLQYTHVDDIAAGIILAVMNEKADGVYNLISEEAVSMGELVQMMHDMFGLDYRFLEDKREAPSAPFMLSRRATRELGWTWRSLADGLRETWALLDEYEVK